jgi:catechol 2,3-dioxygenase-like lactoylglutathione lyase family enzyme
MKTPRGADVNQANEREKASTTQGNGQGVDMKIEVIVIPVSDVDRAKQFYLDLGWRLDVDITKDERFRVVHFTPPGSACSIIFGKSVTTAVPGSVQGIHLIVSDINQAHSELVNRNIPVSDIFHDAGGLFHRVNEEWRISGEDPERLSYRSFLSFSDLDGNGWVMQEVTHRLPGRVDARLTTFRSATELAGALRRAARAHGEREKGIGEKDENWTDRYAEFIFAEQLGMTTSM